MAEKKKAPKRVAAPQGGSKRQAAPSQPQSQQQSQPQSKRSDVVRCENCGEFYSTTYKTCPFCDDRPGRGVTGRRVDVDGASYGSSVTPLQVVLLVISLALIATAAFIVFRLVKPMILPSGGSSSVGTSQSGGQLPSGSQSGGSTSGEGPAPASIVLDRIGPLTLRPGENFQLSATVSPAGVTTPVVWSSSDTSVATVDEYGNITVVYEGSGEARATITAACGEVSATCEIQCGTGSSEPGTTTPGTTTPGTTTPGTSSGGQRTGRITNAENGLNIRSGPGTTYDVVASAANNAVVVILDEADGWYHIDYGNGKTGYVSKDYVTIG